MHTNEIDTVPRDLYLQVLNLLIDAEIWIRSMDLDSSKGIKEAKIFRRRALNEIKPRLGEFRNLSSTSVRPAGNG